MFKNLNLNIAILIALFMGLAIPMFLTTIYLQSNYEQNLKNDNREDLKNLIRIPYFNEQGQFYNTEKKGGNTLYSK